MNQIKQVENNQYEIQQTKIPLETYKELTIWDKPHIEDIIRQVRAPYPIFKKRIKLKDLVQVLNEIWEEDQD